MIPIEWTLHNFSFFVFKDQRAQERLHAAISTFLALVISPILLLVIVNSPSFLFQVVLFIMIMIIIVSEECCCIGFSFKLFLNLPVVIDFKQVVF